MLKPTRTVLARIWWLGRGTATVMGLAMLLALTVGLASTALAGTGIGARFDLGKINKVNAMSTLIGNVDGPLLTVKNSNDPFIRTFRNVPLSLETRPDAGGQRPAPMQVDSNTLVQSLNADLLDGKGASQFADGLGNGTAVDSDRLDGKDSSAFVSSTFGTAPNANNLDGQDSTRFFSGKTYSVENSSLGPGDGGITSRIALCDEGDNVLGGGGGSFADEPILDSFPLGSRSWFVSMRDNSGPSEIRATALCADFPPLR